MPTFTVIAPTGETRSINAATDQTLMQAIRANGIEDLLALCGGGCACGTCHVYVDEAVVGRLKAIEGGEDELLGASAYRRVNSRLSCQVPLSDVLDGATITVAPQD